MEIPKPEKVKLDPKEIARRCLVSLTQRRIEVALGDKSLMSGFEVDLKANVFKSGMLDTTKDPFFRNIIRGGSIEELYILLISRNAADLMGSNLPPVDSIRVFDNVHLREAHQLAHIDFHGEKRTLDSFLLVPETDRLIVPLPYTNARAIRSTVGHLKTFNFLLDLVGRSNPLLISPN